MAAPEHEERCPRCGTPYSPSQEYCLECGAKLPTRSGVVALLGSAWRKRLGWYPGDWIWPSLLALMVAAVAGAASALWLADSSGANDQTVVATSPGASSLQQTQTAPEPTTAPTTSATTATAPAPPPPPPPAKTLVPWPAARNGWTVVLDSLPSVNGRAPALAEARQALHLGMKKVGVIDSSRFSSLHPGYFVVFAGIYESQAAAQSAIIDAHQKGYGGAYPRRITP